MADTHLEMAQLLFNDVVMTPSQLEVKYQQRALPEGAKVTRIAPSPTGFVHFGNLFPALVSERLAHQSGGVFLLRIEDTDAKRKVEGAVEMIIDQFNNYGFNFDEGAVKSGDSGNYGPYRQSERVDIYHVYAKMLVEKGLAYPCFCTADELETMRAEQERQKMPIGYYGKWAKYRDCDIDTVKQLLADKKPYVLRLRSPGLLGGRIKVRDLVKGDLELDENYLDQVLLKSDGVPTYHFAHAVDDHLMRVTHVVRGEEWLSSLPLHLQLFNVLGFKPPKYLHISLLMKKEGDSKRKLSKRKDKEAALSYYHAEGYPADSVMEYVMTVLNSNYEQWHQQNPDKNYRDFKFSVSKLGASSSLFDLDKLLDVSKNVIAAMDAKTVLESVVDWAKQYDIDLYNHILSDKNYALKIFSIGRTGPKPRKDIAKWSDVRDYISFFYDDMFEYKDTLPENISAGDAVMILEKYKGIYHSDDESEIWFERIKKLADELGYAMRPKDYKNEPEKYKGHVGDVSMVLRLAVSGKQCSPDMYSIMRILGHDRVIERLEKAIGVFGGSN